jgi:hypothetical protein
MKKPYFVFKVPIFPTNIHVCFDEAAFKQLQKDKGVPTKVDYLENGAMAETHSMTLSDGRTVLALILDLKAIEDLDCTLVHESVHLVCRIFDYIGEETPGEECRAYLTEYVYKELKRIIDEPSVRKRHRKILSDTSEKVLGTLLQMAVDNNGSAGSDSHPKSKDPVRGTKDTDGKTVPKTGDSV